jgi:hypothetical protein
LLVSADITQPIQNIFGIGWIKSADTINLIIGISSHNSADTKIVQGIRGVTPPTRNPNRGEIWFCAVRLPNLDTTSLDTAAYLGTTAASLDASAYLGTDAASLDATAPDP